MGGRTLKVYKGGKDEGRLGDKVDGGW